MKKAFKKLAILLILILISINLAGCNIIELIDTAIGILDSYTNPDDTDFIYPDFDYNEIETVGDLYTGLMPSEGNVNVLVILIEFPDHKAKSSYTPEYVEEILFGPGNGFETLSSYYKKSSYNKLNITGDVVGWYQTKKRSYSYEYTYDDYASDAILKEALTYYYDNNLIDFSKYDSNNDGYIDAVYGIYSRAESEFSDVWWAYQTSFEDPDTGIGYLDFNGNKFSNYMWASVGFFESDDLFSKTIDTSTFIHETGHLLGLDDYYDYNTVDGSNVGVGGADMMDYNCGDHLPISKMLLGWIEPTLITLGENKTYTISSYTETGTVLLLPLQEYNGIFDEYLLIEYYTPTHLNNTNFYLTTYGVRILYVNANLGETGMDGYYYTLFAHDNSDTDIPFVCMATKSGMMRNDEEADNNDLFKVNDTYRGSSVYYSDSLYRNFVVQVIEFSDNYSNVTISVSFS